MRDFGITSDAEVHLGYRITVMVCSGYFYNLTTFERIFSELVEVFNFCAQRGVIAVNGQGRVRFPYFSAACIDGDFVICAGIIAGAALIGVGVMALELFVL